MHTNYGEVCSKMRYFTKQHLKTVQNNLKMFRQMLHCTQKHFRSEQKHAKVCNYDKFISTKSLHIFSWSAQFLPSTTTQQQQQHQQQQYCNSNRLTHLDRGLPDLPRKRLGFDVQRRRELRNNWNIRESILPNFFFFVKHIFFSTLCC